MSKQFVFWDDLVVRSDKTDWKSFDSNRQAITVADCRQEDLPLVYVNKGFERMTGYSQDEVVGKNCRFLQGVETDRNEIARMREAIKAGEECMVQFINYRKSGELFWNRLSLTPIYDRQKTLSFYIGLQNEVTDMKYIESRLIRHLTDMANRAAGL